MKCGEPWTAPEAADFYAPPDLRNTPAPLLAPSYTRPKTGNVHGTPQAPPPVSVAVSLMADWAMRGHIGIVVITGLLV